MPHAPLWFAAETSAMDGPGPLPRLGLMLAIALSAALARADETRVSPYVPKITGQEAYLHVWTLGLDGVGDGADKLVTIGVDPGRPDAGRVISTASVGGRHEAHGGGFTDDRSRLWVGGLEDSVLYVFDVASDPARPRLEKAHTSFTRDSGGVVGPHTFLALPGRMLIAALSNDEDHGGRTALVEYTNDVEYVRTLWLPVNAPYGYDAAVQPRLNRLLTTSFTGWNNYMRDLTGLSRDEEAMKQFGVSVLVWDLQGRRVLQTLEIPGAPLPIVWAHGPRHDWAFTVTALSAKLWLIARRDDGTFGAEAVVDIGDPAERPMPVDLSLSTDDRFLFVSSFRDGLCRVYDVADPRRPRLVHAVRIGPHLGAIAQSWDGRRLYFTSSFLSRWDRPDRPGRHFVRGFDWNGRTLTQRLSIDFAAAGLGRPRGMFLGGRL